MRTKFSRCLLFRMIAATTLAATVSGCGLIQRQSPGVITPHRGAALVSFPDVTAQPALKVSTYYSQSLTGCMAFKEATISAMTGVNAGADYTALVLNALGSVLSPIATVHLLTAGATAAGGVKSTYANDVTTDNAVNLTIAFDKIYFQPMAQLASTALTGAITADAAPGLVVQIMNLQRQCSLDEARAYINQNLTQGVALTPNGLPLSR